MIKFFKSFKIFIWSFVFSLIHGLKPDQFKQLVHFQLLLERASISSASYRDYLKEFLDSEVKNEK